jgi:tetraacyldisaccharide 4'-kinase
MKLLLKLLTPLYLLITTVDRLFFKIFNFFVFKPRGKVISVGNLSMGGTGKTPVLFELLSDLRTRKCCVISRGYRSPWENSFYLLQGPGPHPQELTDEALLFNQRFREIPLLLGKRRDLSARYAESKIAPELILLDDGFQYRRLRKDYDIVLWDAMSEPEEAALIPAGKLREPVSRLKEASVILLTRCESAEQSRLTYWKTWLRQKAPSVVVIEMVTRCDGLIDAKGLPVRENELPANCLAFSAIGRPESFIRQLDQLGIAVAETRNFRDHHRFSPDELNQLLETAQKNNLSLICTEKDRVKISDSMAEKMRLLTLRIRVCPASGRNLVEELKKKTSFDF